MWVAVVCVALTLSATANAGRDFVNARALLQTADIESVANAVAQQPSVPQMVRIGHARQPRALSNLLQTITWSGQTWCSPAIRLPSVSCSPGLSSSEYPDV